MALHALDGIRVIEVAEWFFVPSCGTVLADWGAEVIKVEHPTRGDPLRGLLTSGMLPGGQGVNYMVEHANRGKRSVGIDLATDAGREVLYRLVETADVYITSFLPAARRRLRIDVEHLHAINPRLIYAKGHGQGQRGPHRENAGFDAASFWSRGGIAMRLTPPDASAPVMQSAAFGDSIGGMFAAGGVAAALFERERTGKGTTVDVSLLGTACWVLAPDILAAHLHGADMPRFPRTENPNPLVNSYRTRDGRWIFCNMLQPDRYWDGFVAALGHEELKTDPKFATALARFQHRSEVIGRIDAIFLERDFADWAQRLTANDCVWAPMQTPAEVARDVQTQANGYLVPGTHPQHGAFHTVASPVQIGDRVVESRGGAPELGQDTEAVLLELGYSWDDVARFKEAQAVS
jgi:crotonobetainyl-CoA:carnitine CoA-transferase CaiB-like acyl-CoA transferase